jgi:WD40 repeat protein
VAEGCTQSKLSPDGNTLACVDREFGISLYDVTRGNELFSKKNFFFTNAFEMLVIELQIFVDAEAGVHAEWVHLGFSTDSKKFLAASPRNAIAVDLATHEQISMHGNLPAMAGIGFAFLDADRVAAMNRDIKDSAILKFPSGEVLQRIPLGGQRLLPAAHGSYVTVGPLKDFMTGVLDLSSNKFVFGSKDNYAVDAYDRMLAMQARNGEIVLYNLDSAKVESHTAVSLSPLGPLRASAMSTDLKWLALSGNTRGAVWDLSTAERLYYTRGFHGAYFDGDAALYADYPKSDPQDRSIARLDLAGRGSQTAVTLGDDSRARQWGNLLVTRRPAGKGGNYYHNATIEVSDVHGGNPLWSRTFSKEVPNMTWSPTFETVLIGWPVDEDAAKDEFKAHPGLQSRLNAMRDRKTAWLLEAMNARTGKETGALIVDTGKGSFHIEYGYAAGDWVVIVDTDGRTRLYSLSTGEQRGSAFGTRSVLSSEAGLLTVESQPGQIDIYELSSMQKRGQLTFASPISLWSFSADGKRMLALTQDQNTFMFDTSRMGIQGKGPSTASTTTPEK